MRRVARLRRTGQRAEIDHAAAAAGADVDALAGERGVALAIIGGLGAQRRLGHIESGTDMGELLGAAGVGEKAEMTGLSGILCAGP